MSAQIQPATAPSDVRVQLEGIPLRMKGAKRWLLWRAEGVIGSHNKPRKKPYYGSGTPRGAGVRLDSPEDVAQLCTFEEAIAAFQSGRYTGLGFALGPDGEGGCWQGIDLDALSKVGWLRFLADDLPGYTETSPSGDGRHAIGYGRQFATLGSNGSGIEAYSTGRFFTVTGDMSGVGDICDLAPYVEQTLAPLHGEKSTPATPRGEAEIATSASEQIEVLSRQTLRELREALYFLDADEYTMWVCCGQRLKPLGPVGRAIWMAWSAQSPKFDSAEAARKWDSFTGERTGYRAIFSNAQKQGWSNPLSTIAAGASSNQWKYTTGFEFVPASELLTTPMPVEYLVDELIEKQSLVLLFGSTNVGKSFVALSWAASVATGSEWFGRTTLRGPVFYIAGEGHAGLARRLKAWSVQTGLALEQAPFWTSKTPAALMDAASAAAVQASIEALVAEHGRPALVIVDTLARNLGDGDENSNADVGIFINHLDRIRLSLGCTVVIVHHSGHNDRERARGGSALTAAMDTAFRLGGGGDAPYRVLKQTKSKESELVPDFKFKLQSVPIGWIDRKGREMESAVIVPCRADEVRSKKLSDGTSSVLSAYIRAAVRYGQEAEDQVLVDVITWQQEYESGNSGKSKDARRKAFQRGVEQLENEGYVKRIGTGSYSGSVEHEEYIAARLAYSMTRK